MTRGVYDSPSQNRANVTNVDEMTEDMTKLTLNNGVEIHALGLGVFQTPPAETRAAVEAALATGYRHRHCRGVRQRARGRRGHPRLHDGELRSPDPRGLTHRQPNNPPDSSDNDR